MFAATPVPQHTTLCSMAVTWCAMSGESEHTAGSGAVIPMSCAALTTLGGPTSRMSCAKTTLIESWVAVHRFTYPPVPGSAFWTCQLLHAGMVMGVLEL